MGKNNKKTMNERTHNSQDLYKDNRNINSNNQTPGKSIAEEFATEFYTQKTNSKHSSDTKH